MSGSDRRGSVGPSDRMQSRLVRRVVVGALLGATLAVVVGCLVGALSFRLGSVGFVTSVVGAGVFGALVGALVGGYSGLESPRPGHEPSEVERPILDRPGLTEREHDVPVVGRSRADEPSDRRG